MYKETHLPSSSSVVLPVEKSILKFMSDGWVDKLRAHNNTIIMRLLCCKLIYIQTINK